MTAFSMNFFEITIRSIASIVVLFFLAKLIGPRQIAQLTFYDYIIGISVGSIAASVAIDTEVPFWLGLWSMFLYILISLLMAWSGNKSIKARRFFSGTPKILYAKGHIIEGNLKKQNLDLNDLLSACRTHGYFYLDDLDYVIMEVNGSLSFLPKSEAQPITPKDMAINVTPVELAANVVIDGHFMSHHLESIGKCPSWLNGELTKRGYQGYDDLLLVTATADGDLYCYPKNQSSKNADLFD